MKILNRNFGFLKHFSMEPRTAWGVRHRSGRRGVSARQGERAILVSRVLLQSVRFCSGLAIRGEVPIACEAVKKIAWASRETYPTWAQAVDSPCRVRLPSCPWGHPERFFHSLLRDGLLSGAPAGASRTDLFDCRAPKFVRAIPARILGSACIHPGGVGGVS
jgi:hypothetical protein